MDHFIFFVFLAFIVFFQCTPHCAKKASCPQGKAALADKAKKAAA